MNSFIQFPILLFAFELCYAVFQSCYSIVQSSHAVLSPIISFQILLFSFPILLCHYEFFYSVSNSIIRFRIMFVQIRNFMTPPPPPPPPIYSVLIAFFRVFLAGVYSCSYSFPSKFLP